MVNIYDPNVRFWDQTTTSGNTTTVRTGTGAYTWVTNTYQNVSTPTYSLQTNTSGGVRKITNLDLRSTWGQPIALLWGHTRVKALPIWANLPIELAQRSNNFEGQSPIGYADDGAVFDYYYDETRPTKGEIRTTFSYFMDFAYAIGYRGRETAPYFIRKLWVDGALVYDATTNFRDERWQWTFHDGSQDGPDPIFIEDPAIDEDFKDIRYPRLMYIVFRRVNIGESGLREPEITVELWASNGAPITVTEYSPAPNVIYPYLGVNWDTRAIYAMSDQAGGRGKVFKYDLDSYQLLTVLDGLPTETNVGAWLYIPSLNAIMLRKGIRNSNRAEFYNADTLRLVGTVGTDGNALSSGGTEFAATMATWSQACAMFDYVEGATYIVTKGIVERRGVNVIKSRKGVYSRPLFINSLLSADIETIAADENNRIFYLLTTTGDVHSFNPRTGATELLYANTDPNLTGRGLFFDPYLDVLLIFHRRGSVLPIREFFTGFNTRTNRVIYTRELNGFLSYWSNGNQYQYSNSRAGTFATGTTTGGASVISIATGQQRKYGNTFYGAIWDSDRLLFVGTAGGQVINRLIAPFNPDDRIGLGSFLQDIGEKLGYTRANVVVAGITDTIIGAIIVDEMSARALLRDICNFFKLDMVESENRLRFSKRQTGSNLTIAATVPLKKMARLSETNDGPVLQTNRLDENDIPAALTVVYLDRDADFSPIPYTTRRNAVNSQSESRLNLPFVMEKAQVVTLANGMLYDAWAVQVQHSFRLPQRYGYLEPGDVLDITDADYSDSVRLLQTTVNGDWSISVRAASVRETEDPFAEVDETRARPLDEGLPTGNPRTLPIVIDTPLWQFELDNPATSIHACLAVSERNETTWPGGMLLYESNTVAKGLVANYRTNPVWGRVVNVLGDATACATDYVNSLRVIMPNPGLTDITEEKSLLAETLFAVGRPGRWELATFGAFSWENGIATFSKLVRGRLGTEVMINTHEPGDYFVLLSNGVAMHAVKIEDVGSVGNYFGIGLGESLNGGIGTSVLIRGNSRRPYEPGDIRATLVGSDLVFSWKRRDRLGLELRGWNNSGPETVPLSEDAELYTLQIQNTATGEVLRTVADIETTGYTYTEAEQLADGYTVGGYARIRVAQVSAQVGIGFNSERFVNVAI
jgi:hypothetical protein